MKGAARLLELVLQALGLAALLLPAFMLALGASLEAAPSVAQGWLVMALAFFLVLCLVELGGKLVGNPAPLPDRDGPPAGAGI